MYAVIDGERPPIRIPTEVKLPALQERVHSIQAFKPPRFGGIFPFNFLSRFYIYTYIYLLYINMYIYIYVYIKLFIN